MKTQRTGTIIEVEHEEYKVTVKARGIRNESNLNAEVEIFYTVDFNDTTRRQKHRTKIYLFSDKNKDDLASILDEKTGGDRPWGIIIDDTCNEIIDKHREGNQEIIMSRVDEHSFRSYQLKPFLREGVPNLMWASGGSGKSYFATLTAILVSQGKGSLGMVPRKTNVLYLDWEEDEDIMRNRIYSIQKGLGLENPEKSDGIVWKKMVGALDTNIEELSSLVSKHGIGYVIVDSLNPALGGKSIDSESVESFFFALRALDVTSLLIDHANKSGERSGKFEIYGSAFKYARARNVYEISKVQKNESDNIEVVFYHRKANDSKFQSLKGFTITFKEQEVWNDAEGEREVILDKVVFEQTALPEMDAQFVQRMDIKELAEEIVKSVKPTANGTKEMHIEEVLNKIETLKEEKISAPALKTLIENSSVLLTDGDMILLKATAMRELEEINVEF
tara:strand:+ start:102 stop:1445 length:1344 start_codon:yes stop_codon:yes gene_type:complete